MTVVKLLHHTEEAHERNIENRNRRSKIRSNGVIVSQNYPITDYYKFLHDKNSQSDNNYNFLHGKITTNQITITSFLHVSHPCNYRLIAFLAANQTKLILHSMYLNKKHLKFHFKVVIYRRKLDILSS